MAEELASASDPLVGTVLADRYRVLAPLGRGGMGAVYRVEHLTLKKELAVKLLHPELSRLDEIARRFEREAEAAARLDHPNIVTVTDFGRTADGLLFLVMELLDGPSLAQVIRPGLDGPDGPHERGTGPGRPLAPRRALLIVRQILRALVEAHGRGIVHRDLKPENVVLVERDGQPDWVKIIDFGIAKITAPSGVPQRPGEALTQAGVVFGTPEYLSPEQAMGEEADGRADLYAAGVMLFELLTGRRPFEASSRVEILSMHLVRETPTVRSVMPDAGDEITPEIEALVRRAMAKKRDDRFPDAASFLAALDQAAGFDGPTPPRRTSDTFSAAPAADRPSTSGPSFARRAIAIVPTTFRILVDRTREAGVPHPRVAVGAALAVALVLFISAALIVRARLRPSPPALAPLLQRVEAMLARGEMEPARTALQQLIIGYPQAPRVHYLYGNLNYAAGERDRAMGDYMRAIERDPQLAKDPLLRANARACLERRGVEAQAALTLLIEKLGEPALPDLVFCAKSCRDERLRRRAAEAALKLGGPNALGPAAPPVEESPKLPPKPPVPTPAPADDKPDPNQALLDQLVKGKSCRDRKRAAVALIATGEARYREPLEKARGRRGGFLGLQDINVCMRRELDAYLASK